MTFEKDYSAKLSIIGQQFLGASRYGGEMRVELERLLAIEPQTADEAEELASRLESLSDSFLRMKRISLSIEIHCLKQQQIIWANLQVLLLNK